MGSIRRPFLNGANHLSHSVFLAYSQGHQTRKLRSHDIADSQFSIIQIKILIQRQRSTLWSIYRRRTRPSPTLYLVKILRNMVTLMGARQRTFLYRNWFKFIRVLYIFFHGLQMGTALPQFLLSFNGASGGVLLVGIVGVRILLPLMIAVIYFSKSSKYTGNYVMHQTLYTYYYFMKPSLAPSKVMDVLIKAAEYMEMPVRRSDDDPIRSCLWQ